MNIEDLPPHLQTLLQYPSFPVHIGEATIEGLGEVSGPKKDFSREINAHFGHPLADTPLTTFRAFVFATITGRCIVALRGDRKRFSRNFGSNLVVRGEYERRAFTFTAPRFYCQRAPGWGSGEEWVLFEPINEPAEIKYEPFSAVAEVRVLQLNFCIQLDDLDRDKSLSVTAAGKTITFLPAPMAGELVRLMDVEAIESAPTSEVRFKTWRGCIESDLSCFAWQVCRFCGLVAQQQTNASQLTLIGQDGLATKTEFYAPMRSDFRDRYLLIGLDFAENGLNQLFSECFDEYTKIESDSGWRRLFNTAWSYDDGVYLENRVGTLLGSVELLIRTSLVERNLFTRAETESKFLPELVGLAKKMLKWDIPNHYIKPAKLYILRNAIAHANPLPYTPQEILHMQQKWGLFLNRRLLIRLGYTGQIRSASWGYSSFSKVDDFSEEENSFAAK